jgi:uncharacterized protein (DUF2252 family)
VVEIQRRMQAISMAFLQPVSINHTPYVLRELQPTEDRVSLNRSKRSLTDIKKVIAIMGSVVAWGQLRSSGRQGSAITDELIEFSKGKKWKDELLKASYEFAKDTLLDAATFATAFDDGEFRLD